MSDQANDSVTGASDPSARSLVSDSRPFKSLVELNNELALPAVPPREGSANILEADSGPQKMVKETAKKGKVQQKLNVKRDKKLKGRAAGPPMSFSSLPKKEQDSPLESLSTSEYSSDGERTDESVRAGPSSRKRITPAVRLRQNPAVRTNPQGTPIDPVIENMNSTGAQTESSLLSRSTSVPKSTRSKSTSRSPALAVSETQSVDSDSCSRSESTSGLDSDSESRHRAQSLDDNNNSENRGYGVAEKQSAIKAEKDSFSGDDQDGQALDSSIVIEGRESGHVAKSEHRQSEPVQLAEIAPSNANKKPDAMTDSNTTRKGSRSNDTRPVSYRYPTLRTMAMMAEATTPEEKAAASRVLEAETAGEGGSSSSSSEESTSNSEGEEDTVRDPSRKTGGIPGLKGVLRRESANFPISKTMCANLS